MGLAILFWDFGVKKGDIQALGAFSYVEPFVGGLLVALFTSATLGWNLLWSGCLVVGGAVLASRGLWGKSSETNLAPRPAVEQELAEASNYIISRIQAILLQGVRSRALAVELEKLARDLDLIIALWDEWDQRPQVPGQGEEQPEAHRVAA
jgi:hypothetical protein